MFLGRTAANGVETTAANNNAVKTKTTSGRLDSSTLCTLAARTLLILLALSQQSGGVKPLLNLLGKIFIHVGTRESAWSICHLRTIRIRTIRT